MGFGIGASGSKNKSSSSMNQNIFDPQAQGLEQMYGRADDQWTAGQAGRDNLQNMVPGATDQMRDVSNLGMQGMQNQVNGGAFGDQSGTINTMMDQMNGRPSETGRMYQDIVGGPGNTYIDPMVDAMKQGSMQNLGMMQAGNAMDANSMGQGGSSRHAMQNAMSNKEINNDMLNRETNMRGQNYDTDMNWKMDIANRADAGTQQNLDRMYNMVNSGNESQRAGMDYSPTAQGNVAGQYAPQMLANNQPWDNMESYSNVMGDPTVLTDQKSKASGKSASGSFGF